MNATTTQCTLRPNSPGHTDCPLPDGSASRSPDLRRREPTWLLRRGAAPTLNDEQPDIADQLLNRSAMSSRLAGVGYDDVLAERVRERLVATEGVTELKMFGGWGITVHGNMAVGVMDTDLIVRVGPDAFDAALRRPGARPFDFTGRPMTGWVFVDGAAITNTRSLNRWIDQGVTFAESLPRKSSTRGSRRSRDRTR
jgi:TfoX/Sxy family transcriptional regulator of competence genes